ncbi:hypothetical protein C3L29_018940 [Pseudomonas sp. MWU12-2534b]|nr:hypothetical protein C3L29_018940 [Pseudomonas sp. MWU12-2534b]
MLRSHIGTILLHSIQLSTAGMRRCNNSATLSVDSIGRIPSRRINNRIDLLSVFIIKQVIWKRSEGYQLSKADQNF